MARHLTDGEIDTLAELEAGARDVATLQQQYAELERQGIDPAYEEWAANLDPADNPEGETFDYADWREVEEWKRQGPRPAGVALADDEYPF